MEHEGQQCDCGAHSITLTRLSPVSQVQGDTRRLEKGLALGPRVLLETGEWEASGWAWALPDPWN